MSAAHLFAALDAASVRDNIQLVLLCVVLVGLALMARSLAELNRRVRGMTSGPVPGRSESLALPEKSSEGAVDAATLVVISAAVYAVLGQPARIVAVAHVEREKALVWSLEGRRQVFQSHLVR